MRAIRQQTVDDQTGPWLVGDGRAAALSAAMTICGSSNRNLGDQDTHEPGPSSVTKEGGPINTDISGPGSREISGQLSRGPGSRSAPTSPINGNVIAPPPNATVVVCVLAGTGRADLWVRNNRGQTPLDLCPADQPLRRALIKCCNAAAQARSNHTTNTTVLESGELPPEQSQLMLYNMPPDYSIKAPYHDAYAPLLSNDPGFQKPCNKGFATRRDADFLKVSSAFADSLMRIGITPPPPHRMLLADNTPVVLIQDEPSTSRATMPTARISGERVDNNVMRGMNDNIDNNNMETNVIENTSVINSNSNGSGSIAVADTFNNR